MEEFEEMLVAARNAMPGNIRIAGQGTDQERYQTVPGMSRVAGINGSMSLRQMLPQLPGTEGRTYNIPAGSTVSMEASLLNRSRVAQAGARLIPIRMPPPPDNAPAGAFYTRPGSFTILEPANFVAADDATPAIAQSLPFQEAPIDLGQMRTRAVRFDMSRREQKGLSDSELSARIMTSIIHGLANLVDQELLDEIDAADMLTPFSLSDAAASGVRFDELRALVGTAGAGAQVDNGRLNVAGVPAELTAETASTFVGSFDRSAIAVMDDLRLIVERKGANGRLLVTCWVDLLPLLPDDTYFWVVN
ncbi:Phage major capsid protein [Halomonas sp. NYA30]